MANIDISNITPRPKLFHNVLVNVYETTLHIDDIKFWPENNRTLFSFEILQRREEKLLEDIDLDVITKFVADQKIHKLSTLAESIRRNGIQVPLIIRQDGKLLDGNRRYFACQWLKTSSKEFDDRVLQVPVLVVREEDVSREVELKILAEANFIDDLKVKWPLDAQARAVEEYYNTVMTENRVDNDEAINEVSKVFAITKTRANDLLDTLELTKIFISEGKSIEEKLLRRAIVEEKFVYFWEFRNKAMKGRSKYSNPEDLSDVKDMFFNLMAMGKSSPIKNVKQAEAVAQSKKDRAAWNVLMDSDGFELSVVTSMLNDKKEGRKAEDKIRLFHAWLKDVENLNGTASNYLLKLQKLIEDKTRMNNSEL